MTFEGTSPDNSNRLTNVYIYLEFIKNGTTIDFILVSFLFLFEIVKEILTLTENMD